MIQYGTLAASCEPRMAQEERRSTNSTTTTAARLAERRRVVSFLQEAEQRRQVGHRRTQSLSSRADFKANFIYQNEGELESTASGQDHRWTCDRTAMGGEREFYLLSNRDEDEHKDEEKTSSPGRKSRKIDDGDAAPYGATKTPHGPARRRQIDKKSTTKFKLKLLFAKVKSLAASYLLLVVTLLLPLVLISAEHQPAGGPRALVINIEARRSPSGSHHALGAPLRRQQRHSDVDGDEHAAENKQQLVAVGRRNLTSGGRTRRSTAAPGPQHEQRPRSAKLLELDALNYLQRYGYMNSSASSSSAVAGSANSNAINLISEDSFHEAVMQFQRFAGIPETGSVDSLTVKYMQMPRCGNKDMSGKGENGKRRRRKRKRRKRRKRYALQGSKWRRQELTYRISQYPSRFAHKKQEVDAQIERAFRIWSQVAPIDFVVKKEGRVHIDIRFANGEHGDGDAFDGPGNTLAHAYFPQYGGDAHFDDQEYWTVDSYAGTNIFQVAAHELGHSLGLGHSSVREALMAPFYQKYKPNFKLHADDVLAIQALYGERNGAEPGEEAPGGGTSTTTSTTTESSVPRRRPVPSEGDDESGGGFFGFGGGSKPADLCLDSKIDAVTRTEDGNTYVFRGAHYWQIKNEGLASGSPGRISRDWDGLPANLDAALTWSDGKTFFFKGDKYWRFFNKRREPGYPKLISVGFAGIPNNLDAAFVWSGNGKTYFFKRDKYWRFDSKQEPPVSGQYPKPLKNWVGLPAGGVDAAFKWENGMTYFFKDELYYRFDDREFEVDNSARPSFPRATAEWWFGCTNSNLPIRRLAVSSSSLSSSAGVPSGSATGDEGDSPPADSRSAAAAGQAGPTNDNDGESGQPSSSQSVLLFHRKPNLTYDSGGGGGSGGTRLAASPSAGSSLTRSILSSLSALFPSSSASPSPGPEPADWSFHRGLGEEVRRQLVKSGRSAPPPPPPQGEGSRWAFPLGSSSSSAGSALSGPTGHNNNNQRDLHRQGAHVSREQSMSELRLAPPPPAGNHSIALLDNNGAALHARGRDNGAPARASEEAEDEEEPVSVRAHDKQQ